MRRLALLLIATLCVSVSAFSETTIYSDLNSDPKNVYDCCNGYQVESPSAVIAVAIPFTIPNGVTRLDHATAGVQWVFDYDRHHFGQWAIYSDRSGLPGGFVSGATFSHMPEINTCCILKNTGNKHHPKLTAGQQYWFEFYAPGNFTIDQWAYNTTKASGNYAVLTQSGWQLQNGTMPAIAIYGK